MIHVRANGAWVSPAIRVNGAWKRLGPQAPGGFTVNGVAVDRYYSATELDLADGAVVAPVDQANGQDATGSTIRFRNVGGMKYFELDGVSESAAIPEVALAGVVMVVAPSGTATNSGVLGRGDSTRYFNVAPDRVRYRSDTTADHMHPGVNTGWQIVALNTEGDDITPGPTRVWRDGQIADATLAKTMLRGQHIGYRSNVDTYWAGRIVFIAIRETPFTDAERKALQAFGAEKFWPTGPEQYLLMVDGIPFTVYTHGIAA